MILNDKFDALIKMKDRNRADMDLFLSQYQHCRDKDARINSELADLAREVVAGMELEKRTLQNQLQREQDDARYHAEESSIRQQEILNKLHRVNCRLAEMEIVAQGQANLSGAGDIIADNDKRVKRTRNQVSFLSDVRTKVLDLMKSAPGRKFLTAEIFDELALLSHVDLQPIRTQWVTAISSALRQLADKELVIMIKDPVLVNIKHYQITAKALETSTNNSI